MLNSYALLVVQIVAESVPVSSSGQVELIQRLVDDGGLNSPVFSTALVWPSHDLIELVHGLTVVIVLIFFRCRWLPICKHGRRLLKHFWPLAAQVLVADSITCLFYIVHAYVKLPDFFLGIGFACTLLLLFSLRWSSSDTHSSFTWKRAGLLGALQGVALLPGISRFAMIYCGSRWFGMNHRRSFELTWLLAIPLFAAATFKALIKFYVTGRSDVLTMPLLMICIFATILSYAVFVGIERLAAQQHLWWLAVYMIFPLCAALFV